MSKLIKDYVARFGDFSGILWPEVIRAMRRALKTGVDQKIMIKLRNMTPAQKRAYTRARNEAERIKDFGFSDREQKKLLAAYCKKFEYLGGFIDKEQLLAMKLAVETGEDQPVLVKQREQIKASMAAYDAKIEAEHAQKFTPELEQHYTARIKNHALIEGDCERPWQNYFAYREAHAAEVEPLTDHDMWYVGQWTSCGIKP